MPTQPAGRGVVLKLLGTMGDPAFRHDAEITQAVVLSDRQRLVTSGNDGTARLWDLRTGRLLQRFVHSHQYVWDVRVLPGEDKLLTAGGENAAVLWDMKTGQRLREFKHSALVFRLAVDTKGQTFAAGDQSGHCILWDIAGGRQLADLNHGKDNSIYTELLDSAGTGLISGGSDSTIRRWRIAESNSLFLKEKDQKIKDGEKEPATNTGGIYTLVPSPDRGRLLVCCERGVRLMDAGTGQEVWRSEVPSAYCAAWSPDGNAIAAVSTKEQLWLLDAATGATRWKVDLSGRTQYGVAMSADGKEILCGALHVLCRFDAVTGKRVYPAADSPLQQDPVKAVLPAPGTSLVYESGSSPGVRVWDRKSRTAERTLIPNRKVTSMAVSADGNTLLVGWEQAVAVVDPRTGQVVRQWETERSSEVALSADGALAIASGGSAGPSVWRVSDGKVQFTPSPGDFSWRAGLALSGDLEFAGAGGGNRVRIWKLPEGELLHELPHQEAPSGCAFLPGKSTRLVTWRSKEVLLWVKEEVTDEPLSEDQAKALIAQLQSRVFRERDSATKRLIAAGKSILPIIRTVRPGSEEQAVRLSQIQTEALRKAQYQLTSTLNLGQEMQSAFAPHPDGRHFALIQGRVPGREIVFGVIRDARLKVLDTIRPDDAPETLTFDSAGLLLVGNCNGTVSEYAVELPPESAQTAPATSRPQTQTAPHGGPAGTRPEFGP